MTLRGEPQWRVDRALGAVRQQEVEEPLETLVSLAATDRAVLALPADVLVVDNDTGARSRGLNRAAAAANGTVVCRVDARSVPPPDYVARCVRRLGRDPSVGVVGAVQRPRPFDDSVAARAAARALANPWLLGAAAYRRAGSSGPVDTVYLGAYRRQELLDLGGFDERLDANEDFDLCRRYRGVGALVWLERGLVVDYEPRTTALELWRQYESFGASKARFWKVTGERPNARQGLALLGGVAGAAAAVSGARRPRRAVAAMVAVAGGAAALDHAAGPDEPDIRVRAAAVGLAPAIVGGWLFGVARGVLGAP